MQKQSKNIIYILLFTYAIIAVLTIIFFNGTGDSGDSITHYLFAKYAPVHPELYFDHWAKPVFVLLFSPFAQFGFIGVKILNAIVSLLTIYFTYKIAIVLNFKNSILVAIIMIFSPLYYILTFSGLTDPLFALFIAISIYLSLKQKHLAACLIISFIPFVRSEGLIIIAVFGLNYLLQRHWKLLPLLLSGHIVYSVAGFFVYHDFLWVFNKIPYATLSSIYGSGHLFHFAMQLVYVIGVPLYLLFWIGLISIIRKTYIKNIIQEELILIVLGFLCFFVAHSLFWYFGIFNSMGLNRVLIGVMPMISIIALEGFNFLAEGIPGKIRNLKTIFQGLIVAYILIFPFTSNPSAINWKREMMLSQEQLSAIDAANFVKTNKGTAHRIIFSHPYLCEVFEIDPFDKDKSITINKSNIEQLKAGDIIIWDSWYGGGQLKIINKELDNNPQLTNIYNAYVSGSDVLFSIYEKNKTVETN